VTTPVHLDTSFLARSVHPDNAEATSLLEWLEQGRPVMVSAMAWAEFLCGPVTDGQRNLAMQVVGEPVPVAAREAELAARLYNASGRRRGSLADCLIAAAAIEGGATLATADSSFTRFADAGLVLA
jgi:predicted nucleic acid-binding protein